MLQRHRDKGPISNYVCFILFYTVFYTAKLKKSKKRKKVLDKSSQNIIFI